MVNKKNLFAAGLTATQEASFQIEMRDKFNNICQANNKSAVTCETSCVETVKIKYLGKGIYSIIFTPKKAGPSSMTMTIGEVGSSIHHMKYHDAHCVFIITTVASN